MSEERGDMIEVLSAGAALAEPNRVEENAIPYVLVPEGYRVDLLERTLLIPARKRGKPVFTNAESLCEYVTKHGQQGATLLYAKVNYEKSLCGVVAVLDDHADQNADWREHTATYSPETSVEWRRWIGQDRKLMGQAEFAAWIEDNLGDIATVDGMPTGTEMLGMALEFEANAERRFKQKINLQSQGMCLEFVDDEDKDTRTKMRVFERFTLGLPVFEGDTVAYPVEARLRYKAADGKVIFWYELIRPDKVFKMAVAEALHSIESNTGFSVLHGNPFPS